MSRTKKKGKGPGYEYWSKRPRSRNHGTAPGRESKKMTHRLERLEGKEETVDQLSDHYEGEITEAMIEEAALRAVENMGKPKDIFHPDYGWIVKGGALTEAGNKFCEDYPEFSYEEEEEET